MNFIISFLATVTSWFVNTFFPETVFGTTRQYAAHFAQIGVRTYGPGYLLYAFIIIVILVLLKIFGFLNPGNLPKKTELKESSLKGKKILFLGSSVTRGMAAQGTSFVEYIGSQTGAVVTKEAVSGTTLVNNGEKSYVERLKKHNSSEKYDAVVVQLSTNDATRNLPLDAIKKAILEIIDYIKMTWDCPTVFYTSPRYDSEKYQQMVSLLYEIADDHDIEIIDLWNNKEINQKKYKKYTYMNDKIHPTKKGYLVWSNVMVDGLKKVLNGEHLVSDRSSFQSYDLKKEKTSGLVKGVLKWVCLIVLALVTVCALAGLHTISDTTGLLKPGNAAKYDVANVAAKEDSPLKGKTILFLGSSVTKGNASYDVTFVDYIGKIDQANVIKDAIAGTTVANVTGYIPAEMSYYPRLRKYDASDNIDAVVIQLSSNDSTSGMPLGEVSDTFDLDQIDSTNFAGGMESLIAYAKQTWNCPVIVYANPEFRGTSLIYNKDAYEGMKNLAAEICKKWDVYYLNMWDDPEVKAVSDKQFFRYMSDTVHPTKQGYLEWWTPMFEKALYSFFE